jgi:hypothetical protein
MLMAGIIFFQVPMPAPVQDSIVPLGLEALHLMGHLCLVQLLKANNPPDMHGELFPQSTETPEANSMRVIISSAFNS